MWNCIEYILFIVYTSLAFALIATLNWVKVAVILFWNSEFVSSSNLLECWATVAVSQNRHRGPCRALLSSKATRSTQHRKYRIWSFVCKGLF